MMNTHNERYDEIKSLLKKSRLLFEQESQINIANSGVVKIDLPIRATV